MRVAIVGLGPKGLFALERLLNRAGDRAIEVDVYEPHPVPGAGAIYDPAQPSFLRMNYPDDQIALWPPDHRLVPDRRAFTEWRGGTSPGGFSSRADVGRYFADGLRDLLAHTPPGARVAVHRTRVTSLAPLTGGWQINRRGAAYDEVLLATGHDTESADGLGADWKHAARLVEGVFPVNRLAAVPPGAAVAIRGFALTCIDAVLALTAGRGGHFVPDLRPGRLRYVAAPSEPGVILPFSRSGRPMLVKPATEIAEAVPGLDAISAAGRERIMSADGLDDLLAVMSRSIVAAVASAGTARPPVDAVLEVMSQVSSGRRWPADVDPARELEQSLDVATGVRPPDVPWAVGHAWRTLFPAIVSRFGDGGLPAEQWPAFRRLSVEMERMAFGPPAANAARLLALVDAGLVDLRGASGGRLVTRSNRTHLATGVHEIPVDCVVDAVLAPPGARGPLIRTLLAEGHARTAPGHRGLDVDREGRCRSADGAMTPGLAAIGRITEDCVIGNDTLSRTLHPLADRWAADVVGPVLVG